MALSRYRNTNVVKQDGVAQHYETVEFPSSSDLAQVPVFRIRVGQFDRLDQLAYKYLKNGEYWWVIALINDLDWMYDFEPGQIIKIPTNVENVLKLV